MANALEMHPVSKRVAFRSVGVPSVAFVLVAALAHCSLDDQGRGDAAPGGASAAGTGGSGDQGASGTGLAGESPGGGAGGGGPGGAPTTGGAGGSETAGAAGSGGAGAGGGQAGSAGAGGSPPLGCDDQKGEFAVENSPNSCFFFLSKSSKAVPPGGPHDDWTWDEARNDCNALSAQLASLATGDEFDDLRELMFEGDTDPPIGNGDDVWIGARTDAAPPPTKEDLANLFTWQSGETWQYVTYGDWPWHADQPSLESDLERCVEMRRQFNYEMNNRKCSDKLHFVLCERPGAPARTR